MPTAITDLIAGYDHHYSDSEFDDSIFGQFSYVSCGNGGVLEYYILGKFTGRSNSLAWVSILPRFIDGIGFDATVRHSIDDGDHYDDITVKSNGNIWEFIKNTFEHRSRDSIWKQLRPDTPMPTEFHGACDALVELIGDWLYSKPRSLVCSRC